MNRLTSLIECFWLGCCVLDMCIENMSIWKIGRCDSIEQKAENETIEWMNWSIERVKLILIFSLLILPCA